VLKEEKLSKERATSDRFGAKRGKAVKRKGNLRQVWCETKKSCQKKGQLKTGLELKEEKLSKERAT
jgi:hypothetical protein